MDALPESTPVIARIARASSRAGALLAAWCVLVIRHVRSLAALRHHTSRGDRARQADLRLESRRARRARGLPGSRARRRDAPRRSARPIDPQPAARGQEALAPPD